MKPLMLLAIVILVAIVIVVSFGLQLAPNPPVAISPDSAGYALYVCPTESAWDGIAASLQPFYHYLIIALFAMVM